MATKKILEKDVIVDGELIRLFKNCPKPDGWFSGIVKTRDMGNICVSGVCTTLVSEGIYIHGVGDAVEGYYGEQVELKTVNIVTNSTKAIRTYLCGPNFPGIGRVTVDKLLDKYGRDVLFMIQQYPDTVKTDCNLSDKQVQVLRHSISLQSASNQLMQTFPNLTIRWVNFLLAKPVFGNTYDSIVKKIRNNPYDLLWIPDLSFKIADAVALYDCGLTWDDNRRLTCVFLRTFQRFMSNTGATYLNLSDRHDTDVFRDEFIRMLGVQVDDVFVSNTIVELSKNGHLHIEKCGNEIHTYTVEMKEYETKILSELLFHMKGGELQSDFDAKMAKYVRRFKVALAADKGNPEFQMSKEQENGIEHVFQNSLSCLYGGPGRGKTTCLKNLARYWCRATKGSVLMLAPTGKAVNRMKESTGWDNCMTIARCLVMNDKSLMNSSSKAKTDMYICDSNGMFLIPKAPTTLVVVDESSMVNFAEASVMLELFHHCHIVFVGDFNQLPPIEPGPFFHELIKSQVVPAFELTTCFRSGVPEIIENADKILNGNSKISLTNHFSLMPCDSETAVQMMISEYQSLLSSGAELSDILLMSPVNRGVGSVRDINERLQAILNPAYTNVIFGYDKKRGRAKYCDTKGWEIPGVVCNGMKFRISDRVMNTENKAAEKWVKYKRRNDMSTDTVAHGYGYFNGDTGTILRYYFADTPDSSPWLAILLDDGRLVSISIEDFQKWVFGYCITIHKSQGSEAKVTMLMLPDSLENPWYIESNFLNRNLLYTGLTRAKNDEFVFGNMQVFSQCVKFPYNYHNVMLGSYINQVVTPYLIQKGLEED